MDNSIKKEEKYILEFRKTFLNLINDKVLFWNSIVVIFSYFYNLPLLNYGVGGSYELRIYDVCGLLFIYYQLTNKLAVLYVVMNINAFSWFKTLIKWICFSLLLTLFFCIYFDDLFAFIQTILYLYHFYTFYLSGVFIYMLCLKKGRFEFYIKLLLLFSILTSVIVILQNFGIIPFLWNKKYFAGYHGFLSGTLGPNKILLGMTSLFMFIFSTSVIIEKRIKINIIIPVIALFLSFYSIIISGSRTAYVGGLVFLCYFAIFNLSRFLSFATVFLSFCLCFLLLNNDFYEKAESVINGRITSKVKHKEDLSSEKVGDLYEDLGSGRKSLTLNTATYLLENPIILPFGLGFNNKEIVIADAASAHNMYLQIIVELGLVGFVLYFGWLFQYLFIKFEVYRGFSTGLKGLIFSVLVTAFFGEQLYPYRALFGLAGLFFVLTSIFMSILHKEHFD